MSRILVYVESAEDRRLLVDWLERDHDVVVGESVEALDADFDCCLLDRHAMERHEEALAERKRRERPVLLPYLLVLPERQLDRAGSNVWRQLESAVAEDRVDELITTPIRKAELRGRLGTLLNARELSLDMRDQRDQLRKIDRLNDVIRRIDKALVQASSREEIEQAVCDRLVEVDRYVGAWVGSDRASSRTVTPRATAGRVTDFLQTVEVTNGGGPTGDGPMGQALERREVQVVPDVRTDASVEPWREDATEYGYRSCIGVPIVYEDTLYGGLIVYADRPETFDADERAVLAELGETIGHAINAAESKRALTTDRLVELDLRVVDEGSVLTRLSTETGAEFRLEGTVSDADTRYLQYLCSDVADEQRVVDAAEDAAAVEHVRFVGEHGGESLFELAVGGQPLVATVGDLGGRVVDLVVEGGTHSVTAAFPYDVDVNAIVEALDAKYDVVDLLAQRETERGVESRQELWSTFRERLTDRQWNAVRTAYFAGFFDWPRGSTGEEVAEAIGVSSATFHEHLRAAQRKLLAILLEGE